MFPVADFSNIVVFDLETSGLDSRSDKIIEFGGVRYARRDGEAQPDAQLGTLVALPPEARLKSEITQLTGITPDMLRRDGMDPAEAARRISDLISADGTLLVAYNAQFDLCFLYKHLHRYGLEECLRSVKMLDALTVYRDRRPYPHKLSDAVSAYGVTAENAHRAVDDARTTWDVLLKMAEEKSDLERYVNLFGYNPKYGVSGPRIRSVTYREQGFSNAVPLYEKNF